MDNFKNSVIKFGGSSVAIHYKKIKEIVKKTKPRFIVVSAPGKKNSNDEKITDLLIKLSKEKSKRKIDNLKKIILKKYESFSSREMREKIMELLNRKLKTKNEEELISFGEEASGICLSEYLNYEFFDPKKIFYIKKNNEIEKNITFRKIIQKIKHKKNLIIPGFYGRNKLGKTKIMKRGGSDITGAYIAGALKLNSYENFTDSQILSVDPNIIKNPTPIKKLDVFELGNLSSQGFEIIHEDVVDLIRENRIKLNIRQTKNMKNFTTIQDNTKEKNTKLIKAISYSKNLTEFLFKEYGLDRKEGILKNIYSIFFKYGIKIKVSNVCIDDISIFTEKTNEKTNKNILGKIKKIYPKLTININEKKLSVLIVVSDYIKKSSKLIGRIILELTKNNIEVLNLNLSSNEFTLIIGIKHSQIKKAIKVLYDKFISY